MGCARLYRQPGIRRPVVRRKTNGSSRGAFRSVRRAPTKCPGQSGTLAVSIIDSFQAATRKVGRAPLPPPPPDKVGAPTRRSRCSRTISSCRQKGRTAARSATVSSREPVSATERNSSIETRFDSRSSPAGNRLRRRRGTPLEILRGRRRLALIRGAR